MAQGTATIAPDTQRGGLGRGGAERGVKERKSESRGGIGGEELSRLLVISGNLMVDP